MIGARLLRLSRRIYPRRLRDALHDDMVEVFVRERRRLRERRGWWAAVLFSARTTLSVLVDAARARLTGVSSSKPGRPPGGLGHDLGHAWTGLRSGPGYVATVVITLALGIGVAAAMFSVVDHVLLEPLPHPAPERIVRVWRTLPQFDWMRSPVSAPNLEDWREQASSFELLAGYSGARRGTYLGDEFPTRIAAGHVAGPLWSILGARTLVGRLPDVGEVDAAAPLAVVAERFWRERLGGDTGVLGSLLEVEGVRPRIVGVLPDEVGMLPRGVDYWMPAAATPSSEERGANFLQAVARLRPGVEAAAAQAEMEGIVGSLAERYPDTSAGSGVWIEPHRDFLVRDIRTLLTMFGGCAALTLIVVCASLTGLTLTRVYSRGRELAVRAALGATTGRIARQLLIESALLGLAGGALGAGIAHGLLRAFLAYGPEGLPRRAEIAVDPGILLYTAVAAIVAGLLIGLMPARRAAHVARRGGLSGGQTGAIEGIAPRGYRALRTLAAGQVALSTVLLVGAALLGNSFLRLAAVDPGFDARGRLTAHVALPESRYGDPESAGIFFEELLERTAALPGVIATGATWALPFRPTYGSGVYEVDGQPVPEGTELLIGLVPVRGDYFRAMGIPILEGRAFGAADGAGSAPVAIVNQTMASRHWPEGGAVGSGFRRGEQEVRIVGVVPDVKRESLAADSLAEAYLPHVQAGWASELYVVIHAEGEPGRLVTPLREALRGMDPELPATSIAPMEELVGRTLTEPRFRMVLVGGFALFAALLSLLGVYGVIRLVVASRTPEIGLRMALGADRAGTAARVVVSGLRLGLLGVGIGVPVAWAVAGTADSLVFEISPTDPATFVAVAIALVAVVGLASWLPALRASRIDPVIALRG